jgi:hypothetical protein
VDFDHDGHLDLITGCYDPGAFYLFRGLGDGEYAERATICDREGNPVLTKPDQKQDFESFGSWITTVDWENDGDLDLLLGSYSGGLLVRINEGTRSEPAFAVTNAEVRVGGSRAQIPDAHATPVVVDWDGDGLWDVLSGSDNGGVYWLKNVGKLGEPAFESVEVLIPRHEGVGYSEELEADQPPRPGIRSQIYATDFNLDGKVDLLVGDFCTNITLRADLTAQDREEMARTKAELAKAGKTISAAMEDLRTQFTAKYPEDQSTSDEATKEWAAMYSALMQSDEYKAATEARTKLDEHYQSFLVKPETPGSFSPYATCHGYVWLYLRK